MAELINDQQEQELACLKAIYRREIITDDEGPKLARLDLPIALGSLLRLHCNESTHGDAHNQFIAHLSPLRIDIVLPTGYPTERPPEAKLNAPWLIETWKQELEGQLEQLWHDHGRTPVLLPYIDYVQDTLQSTAESELAVLDVSAEVGETLLVYNKKKKREDFEQMSFDCSICLETKKGASCHRLEACQHVFCVQCLQSFYSGCIREGTINAVKCPASNCAKQRGVQGCLSSEELLSIRLEQDLVERYTRLRRKLELEIDPSTTWCPRPWCSGAARKEHRPDPPTVQPTPSSSKLTSSTVTPSLTPHFRICSDCAFAFCAECNKSWHGTQNVCYSDTPRPPTSPLTDDPELDEKYVYYVYERCPTCSTPYHKGVGEGCDHMTCPKCGTDFCYLCGNEFVWGHYCSKPEYEFRNVKNWKRVPLVGRMLRRGGSCGIRKFGKEGRRWRVIRESAAAKVVGGFDVKSDGMGVVLCEGRERDK